MTYYEIGQFIWNLRQNPDSGADLSHIRFEHYPEGWVELDYKMHLDGVGCIFRLQDVHEAMQLAVVLLRQQACIVNIAEPKQWRRFLLNKEIRDLLRE